MVEAPAAEAEARLADAKRGREDDTEEEGEAAGNGQEKNDDAKPAGVLGGRAKKLARLSELGKQKASLEKELEKLKENDPAALADLEKELQLVTQAAHRWTDNIFECKSYLVKKRGMEKKQACKFLQISADFDCASVMVCLFVCFECFGCFEKDCMTCVFFTVCFGPF